LTASPQADSTIVMATALTKINSDRAEDCSRMNTPFFAITRAQNGRSRDLRQRLT
jgi:hypothetical protein